MAAFALIALIFGVVEFGRIVLVFNTVTDAARLGARWAITNSTPPTSTSLTNAQVNAIGSGVQTVVTNFLRGGTVNTNSAGLSITTTFPNNTCSGSITPACSGTTPGNPVQVSISYPYDVLVSIYPINITVRGTSEGIITW
jgi:Flp pilus assembly protein TadG